MGMNMQGRPTRPNETTLAPPAPRFGPKGLLQDEPLIFELDGWDRTGVDLPELEGAPSEDLAGLLRDAPIALPGLSEPETVRHYVRLSQMNHAIDLALYPLGSCTMKHNPRLNEKLARLPGFIDLHPLQPVSTAQGALELIDQLAHWLKTLTGLPAVAMTPKAGAHGELCGILAIRAAHRAKGDTGRTTVLVPTSAHGGGGPGAGPVVLSEALAPFAPVPYVTHGPEGFQLAETDAQAFGRMSAFHGQMGMFVRAYAYMLSHGADGLRQAAEDAVLNANYVKARLSGVMSPAFPDGPCMHEALFDDSWLEGTGVSTLDFAKAMIDEGFHPMTMYFPLVVHGAMLIEPTETESKAELDRFCDTLTRLAEAVRAGDVERFTGAPYFAPRKRLDETQAARKPRLNWRPEVAVAAE